VKEDTRFPFIESIAKADRTTICYLFCRSKRKNIL